MTGIAISIEEDDGVLWYFYANPRNDLVLPRRPHQWQFVHDAPDVLRARAMDLRERIVKAGLFER